MPTIIIAQNGTIQNQSAFIFTLVLSKYIYIYMFINMYIHIYIYIYSIYQRLSRTHCNLHSTSLFLSLSLSIFSLSVYLRWRLSALPPTPNGYTFMHLPVLLPPTPDGYGFLDMVARALHVITAPPPLVVVFVVAYVAQYGNVSTWLCELIYGGMCLARFCKTWRRSSTWLWPSATCANLDFGKISISYRCVSLSKQCFTMNSLQVWPIQVTRSYTYTCTYTNTYTYANARTDTAATLYRHPYPSGEGGGKDWVRWPLAEPIPIGGEGETSGSAGRWRIYVYIYVYMKMSYTLES